MEILNVDNVSKRFNDHGSIVQALQNVSFTISEGEMVAIIGPSGSGKTTLLNLIGAITAPDEGRIFVNGKCLDNLGDNEKCQIRNKYFGYIVQDFALIEGETAMENIMVPTLYSKDKKPSGEYRKLIERMAEELNIKSRLKTKVKKLSGGERQRVAVIRSMVCDQRIILADEPTGALDKENSEIVMKYLRKTVSEDKKAAIIVTHDLNVADQCDRVLKLERGKLA